VKNEEGLVAASRLHNFGFSLERLPYGNTVTKLFRLLCDAISGHYAVGPYVRRDVISNYRIMQQDIYWEQCIFVVRKNSILLPLLDDLILRVFEAGLASYWEHRVRGQQKWKFRRWGSCFVGGVSIYGHVSAEGNKLLSAPRPRARHCQIEVDSRGRYLCHPPDRLRRLHHNFPYRNRE
jgi:hypothetical protein